MMMEQTREQSNAEASPPPPRLDKPDPSSATANRSGGHADTGGSWQDAGGCAGGWGAGAMWELGRLGAAVGKSEGVSLFAKGGMGGCVEAGETTWGSSQPPISPPYPPRMMLRGVFLLSLRGFFLCPVK